MPHKLVIAETPTSSEAYQKLFKQFEALSKRLPSDEDRTELDGILSIVAKEWDSVPDLIVQIVNRFIQGAIRQDRGLLAQQICPLCDQGLKIEDLNGRFVHYEAGKKDEPRRCTASKIWTLPLPNVQVRVERDE